ncbi:hypothetical protein [Rickettsia felis]|uniref:hypothetical protein n=1 Tax=Rickettsia felis TaxID=42862 RepID=UPI000A50956A|nr:hypothetical protein [Rickettsia felis]
MYHPARHCQREYQVVIARSEAMRQSRKIIKKILIYRIFYWIASSIAMQFPRNDG